MQVRRSESEERRRVRSSCREQGQGCMRREWNWGWEAFDADHMVRNRVVVVGREG